MSFRRILLIVAIIFAFGPTLPLLAQQRPPSASSTSDLDQRLEDLRAIFEDQTVPGDEINRRILSIDRHSNT